MWQLKVNLRSTQVSRNLSAWVDPETQLICFDISGATPISRRINVLAHELGHVLQLEDNILPGSLFCDDYEYDATIRGFVFAPTSEYLDEERLSLRYLRGGD